MIVSLFLVKYLVSRFLLLGLSDAFGGFTELFMISILALIVVSAPKRFRPMTFCLLSIIYGTTLAFMSIYYNFFERFPTIFNLAELGEAAGVTGVGGLFSPVYLLYYIDIIILFFGYIFIKRISRLFHSDAKNFLPFVLIFVLTVTISGISMVTNDKIAFATDKYNVTEYGFMGYQAIVIANAIESNLSVKSSKIPKKTDSNIKEEETKSEFFGVAKGKNLIIIQLEAFQNFAVGATLDGVELTPNFNKLIKDSVYFNHAISQISQGNTADAEFLANTSIYALTNEAAFKTQAIRDYYSLPKILEKNGYYTATFHANTAAFWNRINMYPALGFDKFYDKPFFEDKNYSEANDKIGIGASDEVFYKKVITELNSYKNEGKTFYTHLITLSGHFPFVIPASKSLLKIPSEYSDTTVAKYLQAAAYTDKTLGDFLTSLKDSGLYDDSLIVIYGDHFGLSTSKLQDNDNEFLKEILGRSYDKMDMMNVPLIFKLPNSLGARLEEKIAGQIDIMPTILALMGIEDKDVIAFGHNLFFEENNLIGIRYYMPKGSYADNNTLVSSDGKIYSLDHKPTNITIDPIKRDKVLQLMNESDSYLKNLKTLTQNK